MNTREILAAADVPPRSDLFALDIQALGTPYVESITNFTRRLATAHGVTPLTLSRWVHANFTPQFGIAASMPVGCKDSYRLNGLGTVAQHYGQALASATRCQDVLATNFAVLTPLITSSQFISRESRWCARCHADAEAQGNEPAELLIWSLKGLRHCPVHGCLLSDTCPHCGRRRSTYALRPGSAHICPSCDGSLTSPGRQMGRPGAPYTHQCGIQHVLLDLVAALPTIVAQGAAPTIRSRLQAIIEENFSNNASQLARAANISKGSLSDWLSGQHSPDMDSLIRVSLAAARPLSFFFLDTTSHLHSENGDEEEAEVTIIPRRSRRPIPYTDSELQQNLAAAMKSGESLRALSIRLGVDPTTLKNRQPSLAAKVISRAKDRRGIEKSMRTARQIGMVRDAVSACEQAGIYPSRNRVAARIGARSMYTRSDFADEWRRLVRENRFITR